MHGIGRRAAQGRCAEIPQQHGLAAGRAAGSGDDRRAQALRAAVGAKASREQPVAVGHMNGVQMTDARRREAARRRIGPGFQIPRRIADDDGLARRAA